MSESGKEELQEWLRKAENDLHAAAVDLEADPALLEDAMFHCQQASEKLLKAFLTAHDLDILYRQCVELDPSLESEANSVAELSVFACQFRIDCADTFLERDSLSTAIGALEIEPAEPSHQVCP